MITIEVWKDIKGYEGFYQISSLGRIKSLDRYVIDKKGFTRFKGGKFLKNDLLDNDGYCHIRLNRDGIGKTYTVHKLVGLHFLEIPSDFNDIRYEINHKDNNRSNNNCNNLEWVTHADNIRYSVKSGTAHCINGLWKYSAHKLNLYTEDMIFVKKFESTTDCAKYLIDNNISKAKSVSQLACNISRVVDKDKKYINHYFKTA